MPEGSITNTFLMLLASVALIGGLLIFLKKYIEKQRNLSGFSNINILGKRSLSAKNHLYVIEAEGKKLLIAVSDKNINLISELDNDQTAEDGFTLAKKKTPNKQTSSGELSFKEFLRSQLGKG